MHIQSNHRYLQMINHGLMNLIAPQLQDDQSKAVIGMLHGALSELYKRELRTPELLKETNQTGVTIAQSLVDWVESNVGSELQGDNDARKSQLAKLHDATSSVDDYAGLREINNQLNALINELMEVLSSSRDDCNSEGVSKLMRACADWDYSYGALQREPLAFEPFDLGELPEGEDLNEENLQAFLKQQGSTDKVVSITKIPGGMAKHTYSVALQKEDGGNEDLIIRKEDPRPIFHRGACRVAAEFELLKLVADAGFNAPMPLMLAHNESAFDGDFYLMTKRPGVVPGNFFGPLMELKEELLLDIAANMAHLHSFDIDVFAPYFDKHISPDIVKGDIRNAYRIEIEFWKNEYATQSPIPPSPANAYVWDWLLENIPDNTNRPVLVHGDFNIHNFLVESDRVSAVLDWELALAGDPAQDLAYIKPNIEAFVDWDKFMQTYYDHGGQPIDESTFGFYIAFANARPLIGSLRNMYLFDTATNDDIRFPYIDTEFLPQFEKNILEHSD